MASIVPFAPSHQPRFKELNLQWIQQYFAVEPMDLYQLDNPEITIMAKGGEIFFCLDEKQQVMGSAVVPHHEEHKGEEKEEKEGQKA